MTHNEAFLSDSVQKLQDENDRLRADLAAAEKFKAFVHSYLDQHGVPHGDPTNRHQIEGCRFGARLDLLFADLAAAVGELERCRAALKTIQGLGYAYDDHAQPEWANVAAAALRPAGDQAKGGG